MTLWSALLLTITRTAFPLLHRARTVENLLLSIAVQSLLDTRGVRHNDRQRTGTPRHARRPNTPPDGGTDYMAGLQSTRSSSRLVSGHFVQPFGTGLLSGRDTRDIVDPMATPYLDWMHWPNTTYSNDHTANYNQDQEVMAMSLRYIIQVTHDRTNYTIWINGIRFSKLESAQDSGSMHRTWISNPFLHQQCHVSSAIIYINLHIWIFPIIALLYTRND